jgi:predicted ABC-type ATPase
MPEEELKEVIMLGGPNGAGKTTTAARLLPRVLSIREFVNADEIARGLSPFNPEGSALAAGRVMVERLDALAKSGQSFAFETTCSGRSHVRFLRTCRDLGFRLSFMFFWLPSADLAIERVARRVRQGGHHIPDDVVGRRYLAGLYNMRHLYLPMADVGLVVDNSDEGGGTIAEHRLGTPLIVRDKVRWQQIVEATP